MLRTIFCVLCLTLTLVSGAFAQNSLNENELFSDPSADEMITDRPPAGKTEGAAFVRSKEFSGELTSALADVFSSTSSHNTLYTYTVSNLFLDIRLPEGTKAFANTEITYVSQTKATEVALREMFLDFNISNRAYFRTGKQVLQWGRCSLWNPTDLINVEKKPFIRKIGYREGAYGMKVHIPFRTDANIYGFLDTGSAHDAGGTAASVKFEFMAGKGTEMAFSGWVKERNNPVFGYDFSTRVLNTDIVGEARTSQGYNRNLLKEENGVLSVTENKDDMATLASLNLTRRYRLGNFKDRVSVSTELFYNQAGYDYNVFRDQAKKMFFLANDLYEMHYYAKYYAALFTTVGRFLTSDMSLNTNYIHNFQDNSGMLTAGVTYTNINDFSAGILAIANLGQPDSEYTYTNEALSLQVTFGITF